MGSAGQKARTLQHGGESGAKLQQQLPVPSETKGGLGGGEPGHIPPCSTTDTAEASRKALMCIYRMVLLHLTQHFHVSVVHRGCQHVV